MTTSTEVQPVFETAKLLGIIYSEPKPRNGKSGYNVLKLERNNQTYPCLQPYEKWDDDPDQIKKYFGKDVRIKLDSRGQIRIHQDMQKEMLEQINSSIEANQENSEILAINLQKLYEEVQDVKSLTCKCLIKLESVDETQILIDKDLNKFRHIFQMWNGQDHAIPKD